MVGGGLDLKAKIAHRGIQEFQAGAAASRSVVVGLVGPR